MATIPHLSEATLEWFRWVFFMPGQRNGSWKDEVRAEHVVQPSVPDGEQNVSWLLAAAPWQCTICTSSMPFVAQTCVSKILEPEPDNKLV